MCFRTLFKTAFSSSPSILSSTTTSVFPTFTSVLLSQTTIGLRKAAHTTLSFYMSLTRPSNAVVHSKDFMLALAQAYDVGLGTSTISYGHLYLSVRDAPQRNPDNLFLQTKGNHFDAFHNLPTALLTGLTPADPSRASIYSL